MVVSGNDPLESLLSSILVAYSPVESNFRKIAKNLENCFNDVVKNGNLNGAAGDINVEQVAAQLNVKISRRHLVINGGFQKERVPIKIFLGIFSENRGSNHNNNFSFEQDWDENVNVNLSEKELQERSICSESAAVSVPPVEIPTCSVLKSALAGGISCAFSTLLMHPVDTVKTQVQASTLSFAEILSKLPQLGVQGLYKGSIPAIVGQFSSHCLRTGICEVSKIVLMNVAPALPEIQVQSMGSFCGTFLGTTMRIPFEVLKQRLQADQFNHVGKAMVGTWQQDGLRGFFRGTGMTLCRELPFYVAGTSLYLESKKAVQKLIGRELEPWETIAVGAISGGLTAVMTTPFDVIKTRMMTAVQGEPTTMTIVALSILRHEGPLGLFRGAVPRFFWVAPLGAINFAGYELIRKAMD